MKKNNQKMIFSYHLVDNSPWPVIISLGVFLIALGLLQWFHFQTLTLLGIGIFSTMLSSIQWWRDINREGTYQGFHTQKVELGLRGGMVLFIVSEVMFFFSFFWAFFHSSLSPVHQIGLSWPPKGVEAIEPMAAPLLNTMILLVSGVTVTWAHFSILSGKLNQAKFSLIITVGLGLYFSRIQLWEYSHSSFSMADSVFGSIFFVATGFHGLHILVGTVFLVVCCFRLEQKMLSSSHHFGFEAAAWYWHFVDVVWLFLFSLIYWWGC